QVWRGRWGSGRTMSAQKPPYPTLDESDFDDFWLGADGEVWRMVGFCVQPTVTFQRVSDGERRSGATGSLIVREFTRLRPVEVDTAVPGGRKAAPDSEKRSDVERASARVVEADGTEQA